MTLALTGGTAAPTGARLKGGIIGGIAGNAPQPSTSATSGGGLLANVVANAPVYHGATSSTVPGPVAQTQTTVGGTDYASQLANDPGLQSQLAAINAQGTSNAANLTAEQQRALAQYGQIPDNLGQYAGSIGQVNVDQTTRDLANAATQGGVSTVAQLLKAYQNQQQGDNASLAARGMLRSGALGQHANLDLTAYQQSQYDATQKLLDYLGSAYQNFLGQQSQGQTAAANATNQALQNLIAQINAGQLGAAPNGPVNAPDTSQPYQDAGPGGYTEQGSNDYGGQNPDVAPYSPLPVNSLAPYATTTSGNKTGGSANQKQGTFSIH